MAPATSSSGSPVSRRGVLASALVVPVGLLSACRVRLEDDAPRVPLIPTREPGEDEAIVVAAWREATELVRMATALGPAGANALRLHRAHVAVLDQDLRDRAVPESVRASATTPAPTTSSATGASTRPPTDPASPAEPARQGPSALGTLEAAAWSPEARARLGTAHAQQVAMLGSFATCRARLATTLGHPIAWPAWSATESPADAALVAAHREARYYLEVAAARSSADGSRPAITAELDRVTGLVVRLESRARTGPTASAPSPSVTPLARSTSTPAAGPEARAGVGWPLPFPVTDDASARRLVTHALRRLELACGAAWPSAAEDSEAILTVCRLVDATLASGASWGVPLRAFPGLTP